LDIFRIKVLKDVWIVDLESIRQVLGHQLSLTANFVRMESIQGLPMHLPFPNVLPAVLEVIVLLDAVCA
jgi:hypothetical protein